MIIKNFIFLVLFPVYLAHCQSLINEYHIDSLHFANLHEESIQLRKKFINGLNNDKAIERNNLKLKLSEYFVTNSWAEGLVLLENIKDNVLNTNILSDKYKIEFYNSYYHAVAFLNADWEKSLSIAKTCLNKIENGQIAASISNKTELVYDIAFIYGELNQPYEAINFYEKAAALYAELGIEETSDMALLYNNLGYEYSKLSNYKKCNTYYVLATEIWDKQPNEHSNYLTTAYNNLIYNFIPYGEIKKAKFYLSKLKTVARQLDKTDLKNFQKVQLSVLLNEMRIYDFENKIEIIESHQQLINYYENITNNENYINYYSSANNILINYLIENKQFKDAEKLAFTSESYLKKYAYNEGLLVLYSLMVVLKREKEDYETALNYVNKAIVIADKTSKGNQAGLMLSKGIILKKMDNLDEAENYYNQAQKILDEQQSADIETLSYYTEIANFYLKKYEIHPDHKSLNQAFSLFKNCVNQFNVIYKNGLFNPKLDEYLDIIHEGLLTIAQNDASKQALILDDVENTTSKYLWSNFIKNNTSGDLLNLDQNYNTLQNVNAEVVYYKTEIQKEKEKETPDGSKLEDLNYKIFELLSQTEQLELKLLQSNANYKNLYEPKYSTSEFILSLNTEETLINFCPTKNHIYVIFLNKLGIQKIIKIEDKEKLYQEIKTYRESLLNKIDVTQHSKKLYNILLHEIPTTSTQLTIIAKGILSLLPFETLQSNHKYLVNQYVINYASSLTLYSLQKSLSTKKDFKLAVFNPNYEKSSFSDLPFAKQEANYLKEQFKATLFSDTLANKNSFLDNIKNYNIYHLAMHAQVNSEDEDASKLIFTSENLYFSDMYAQQLPLDLVVLSACETGNGKSIEGEGVISLSRAFTFSGVAATVHSLWQTPDKQGAEIMQYFYEFLADGLPKNKALQQAKLKFITSAKAEELKHPYYWAGFVLSGNPNALVSAKHYWLYWLLGLTVLALVVFGLLKLRK